MENWSRAFARQAASDLDVYELLSGSTVPVSQRLHYLQMWLEKLCKAFLWSQAYQTEMKHQVVAHVLRGLVADYWHRVDFRKATNISAFREICREIDLLHPQIDAAGRRPENVEYPWAAASGAIEVPALWKFGLAQRLYTVPGVLLLKAAAGITRNPSVFLKTD